MSILTRKISYIGCLEQLAPGEDLEGKRAKSRGDGAGVERDTDIVIKHLDTICIESAVEN